MQDAKANAFDIAIGGISRTPQREAELTLSDDYLETGKTILCRKADAARFTSIADIDEPDVRVGRTVRAAMNEAFAGAKSIMLTVAFSRRMSTSRSRLPWAERMS